MPIEEDVNLQDGRQGDFSMEPAFKAKICITRDYDSFSGAGS
jgi:hypothetical protein